jgi:hypothetical protein
VRVNAHALPCAFMSRHPSLSLPNRPYSRPLALVRRASQRRIEVFSPKLGRRLSLSSYGAWQLWLALEANPMVSGFCERPAYADATDRRVIDFWVQLRPGGAEFSEFWLLDNPDHTEQADAAAGAWAQHDSPTHAHQAHGLPLRRIARRDLLAWNTPVSNWARIVPYLVTWRRFSDAVLAQSIVVYLGRAHTLDDILAHFADHDLPMVEAALYSLVAGGRVLSPDLASSPLGGDTRFSRA